MFLPILQSMSDQLDEGEMPQGNVIGNAASLDASPEAYGKYL